MPPTYRERLRIEGLTLAASGALASAGLWAASEQARRRPQSTVIQLLLLVVLLGRRGSGATERALAEARPIPAPALGSGEPTPLWQLPLIVIGQAVFLGKVIEPLVKALRVPVPKRLQGRAGWDAALRATAGSGIVGLFQAAVLERAVARAEAAQGRTYYRVAGSGLLSGTNLGYPDPTPAPTPAAPATAPIH